jgi:hypothetical protein
VSLVALADRLLKTCDIGDAGGDESPEEIMAALDIDAAAAEMALRDLLDDHAGLDLIARQLAA